jgi:hypothetical protein
VCCQSMRDTEDPQGNAGSHRHFELRRQRPNHQIIEIAASSSYSDILSAIDREADRCRARGVLQSLLPAPLISITNLANRRNIARSMIFACASPGERINL